MNWKINEVANLYDISSHTLRYYEEIDLVVPMRGNNNYRIYTEEHLQKLNIIRDLRKLNMSLEQIKDYLENRTVDKTINLLKTQNDFIEKELKDLQEKQRRISERIELFAHTDQIKEGEITLVEYPDRYVIASLEKDIESSHVDVSLKELYKKYESKLPYLDQNVFGSFLYFNDTHDNFPLKHRVFYFIEKAISQTLTIPKGTYATLCYKGNYTKTQRYLMKLKEYIEKNRYASEGDFLATYIIDFHETIKVDEYVTRIEVKIRDL
ncbi:MerR family transcriptional regulator [Metabacillus niabensis]|uniref:MerR family transcriptional regulator n=1 Tax=Metabacillus niabensis TaxID=324854 RepID=UPI00399F79C1